MNIAINGRGEFHNALQSDFDKVEHFKRQHGFVPRIQEKRNRAKKSSSSDAENKAQDSGDEEEDGEVDEDTEDKTKYVWRPNVVQWEAVKRCLRAHDVDIIEENIHTTPAGHIPYRIPPPWNTEEHPVPAWQPPFPWESTDDPDTQLAMKTSFKDSKGYTENEDIVLNSSKALGKSYNLSGLYQKVLNYYSLAFKSTHPEGETVRSGASASTSLNSLTNSFADLRQIMTPIILSNPLPPEADNIILQGLGFSSVRMSQHPAIIAVGLKWATHLPHLAWHSLIDGQPMIMDSPEMPRSQIEIVCSEAGTFIYAYLEAKFKADYDKGTPEEYVDLQNLPGADVIKPSEKVCNLLHMLQSLTFI
jgi:hypothetical protein